jgi:hypothetical protein
MGITVIHLLNSGLFFTFKPIQDTNLKGTIFLTVDIVHIFHLCSLLKACNCEQQRVHFYEGFHILPWFCSIINIILENHKIIPKMGNKIATKELLFSSCTLFNILLDFPL